MCSLSLRPCIHCLIFCAFDTLVRSGFFFPRCYVMINLPLGTWRPLAPQRIWRTLCAIPACLAFSPTYKTGICILIPLWPLSETVSQLFASLIPGYCLEEKSHQISPTGSCYFELIFSYFLPTAWGRGQCGNHTELWPHVCSCTSVCVCVQPGKERKGKKKSTEAFWKHQAQSVLICSGTRRNRAHCLK